MITSIEIITKILEIEKKYSLFSIKNSKERYYWDFIRYDVLYQLLIIKDIFKSTEHLESKSSFYNRIKFLVQLAYNELSFTLTARRKPVLFLNVSRSIDQNGKAYDSVMKDLNDYCKADKYIIESFGNAKFQAKNKYKNRYFLHSIELLKKIKKDHTHFEYKNIETILNKEFDLNYNWSNKIARILNEQEAERTVFRRILKRIKPKIIFFNRNGTLKSMISEAHSQKIRVIEMQHGSITPASFFYNYNNDDDLTNLDTLPDLLLTFGSYWNNKVTKHIPAQVIGNDEFSVEVSKRNNNRKKGITFISGKFVFKELLNFVIELAPQLEHYTIYFKLHPGEKEHILPAKNGVKRYGNIKVIYDEMTVNQLLFKSEALVLIQSTCTYTALQMGLKVYILKRQYYAESNDVFDLPQVKLVDTPSEIINDLQTSERVNVKGNSLEFFSPFNEEAYNKLLNY